CPAPTSIPLLRVRCPPAHRPLHSFPTRRSSDLERRQQVIEHATPSLGSWPLGEEREHPLQRDPARRLEQHDLVAPERGRELRTRSEEHTSELQSRGHLVCRLLLEKKKKNHEPTC